MVLKFVTHIRFFKNIQLKASLCKIVLNKSWRFSSNATLIRVKTQKLRQGGSLTIIGTASYLTVKVILLHQKDLHTPPLTWVLLDLPVPNKNTIESILFRYWWVQKDPCTPPAPLALHTKHLHSRYSHQNRQLHEFQQ